MGVKFTPKQEVRRRKPGVVDLPLGTLFRNERGTIGVRTTRGNSDERGCFLFIDEPGGTRMVWWPDADLTEIHLRPWAQEVDVLKGELTVTFSSK